MVQVSGEGNSDHGPSLGVFWVPSSRGLENTVFVNLRRFFVKRKFCFGENSAQISFRRKFGVNFVSAKIRRKFRFGVNFVSA